MIWNDLNLPPINLYNAPQRKDTDGEGSRNSSSSLGRD